MGMKLMKRKGTDKVIPFDPMIWEHHRDEYEKVPEAFVRNGKLVRESADERAQKNQEPVLPDGEEVITRLSELSALTKQQLMDKAKEDFGITLNHRRSKTKLLHQLREVVRFEATIDPNITGPKRKIAVQQFYLKEFLDED